MNNSDTALLAREGWNVECLSPLELRHTETGSFATQLAAEAVLEYLRENDEMATPLPEARSKEEELAVTLKALFEWVSVSEKIDTEVEWEFLFNLVFSENCSQKVSKLREELGIKFEYYDPDTSYEEDVLAYTNALKALAKQLAAYFPAFNEFR